MFAPTRPLSHVHGHTHGRVLLALGLLVTLFQLWLGMGVMPNQPSQSSQGNAQASFWGEICTSHGIVSPADNGSPEHTPATHDCCTACGTPAPLLLAAAASAVPQRLTFAPLLARVHDTPRTISIYASPPSRAPPLS